MAERALVPYVEPDQIIPRPKPLKKNKSKAGSNGKSLGAQRVATLLLGMDVLVHDEFYYPQCKDKGPLKFDFFVVVNGRAGVIEYDGRQHFEVVEALHVDEAALKASKERDLIKNRFLRERGISLLRIAYTEDNTIEKWVTDYIRALETAKIPVYTFSSSLLYINPFGDEPAGCVVM